MENENEEVARVLREDSSNQDLLTTEAIEPFQRAVVSPSIAVQLYFEYVSQ